MKENTLAVFENYKIRKIYDEEAETWYFSVVDIVQALIQQPEYQAARKYWNKLKERLKKEGSQSATNCHRLKLEAAPPPAPPIEGGEMLRYPAACLLRGGSLRRGRFSMPRKT